MNIWLALDRLENKNAEDILTKIRQIEELNNKSYEYYFKVTPSPVGTEVSFICAELNIDINITNYNNF